MRSVVIAALLLAGCEEDSRCAVDIGQLYPDTTSVFQVPASVPSNAPFIVRVRTSGGGCIEADSTDVDAGPGGALIIPYDRYCNAPEIGACLANQVPIEHEARLEFGTAGTKTIRIRSRHEYSRDGELVEELVDTPFIVELQ